MCKAIRSAQKVLSKTKNTFLSAYVVRYFSCKYHSEESIQDFASRLLYRAQFPAGDIHYSNGE